MLGRGVPQATGLRPVCFAVFGASVAGTSLYLGVMGVKYYVKY